MTFKMFCEDNDGKHEYSCTMASIPNTLFMKFAKKIAKKDLEENGIQKDTHVTILYGTHTDNVHEIKAVLADSGIKKIHVKLKRLSYFPAGEDGVPLKVAVESEELRKLNKLLSKLPNSNEFPTYKPHITIAYLKEGTEKKYLDEDPFEGKEFTTSDIVFSKQDGIKVYFDLADL